jgi:hypothetical protein
MIGHPQTYKLGSVSKLVKGSILLMFAALLGALAWYGEVAPHRDGSPQYIVSFAISPVAIIFAWWGCSKLADIDSRRLSTRVVALSLPWGVMPYVLLLGSPGYVFNLGFLLAAMSSGLAILRFPSSEA